MAAPNTSKQDVNPDGPRGFDDYEYKLGDQLRGERATLGKSLLDVQRELRIKASYVAAIENCDPTAFETQGFVAGYVKSYARYLNLDPERVFRDFRQESGFESAHGMSEKASSLRRSSAHSDQVKLSARQGPNPFAQSQTPFVPSQAGFLGGIEPGAVGSLMVVIGLIGALGFGGYSVLRQIQTVTLAPVEQSPVVLAELDPIASGQTVQESSELLDGAASASKQVVTLDQLYRPQALDLPILVSRDAPIATLDPQSLAGLERPALDIESQSVSEDELRGLEAETLATPSVPQVVAEPDPAVEIFALRPAWVRVTAADGSTLFQNTLGAGESFALERGLSGAQLRSGMAGYVYLKIGESFYGPVGNGTRVQSKIALNSDEVLETFASVKLEENIELAQKVAELNAVIDVENAALRSID